jgi:hypothetical protein
MKLNDDENPLKCDVASHHHQPTTSRSIFGSSHPAPASRPAQIVTPPGLRESYTSFTETRSPLQNLFAPAVVDSTTDMASPLPLQHANTVLCRHVGDFSSQLLKAFVASSKFYFSKNVCAVKWIWSWNCMHLNMCLFKVQAWCTTTGLCNYWTIRNRDGRVPVVARRLRARSCAARLTPRKYITWTIIHVYLLQWYYWPYYKLASFHCSACEIFY